MTRKSRVRSLELATTAILYLARVKKREVVMLQSGQPVDEKGVQKRARQRAEIVPLEKQMLCCRWR